MMKSYDEQRYPVAIAVRLIWYDGFTYCDCIKGLNTGHALYLARKNWPDAEMVELLPES